MSKNEENNNLELVKSKVSGMQKMIEETVVTNDEELASISDKIKDIKKLGKYVKGLKDEMVAPAKKTIELAKEWFDGPLKSCDNAEIVLKGKAQKYLVAKEEARLKAEKKIQEDLEKGKIKKVETAVKKLENLPDQQKNVNTEKSSLRMQKRNVAEITDKNLIPDEYWVVDEVRVKRESLERVKNGGEPIAGVTIREESTMVSM